MRSIKNYGKITGTTYRYLIAEGKTVKHIPVYGGKYAEYKIEDLTKKDAEYIGARINEIVPHEVDSDENEFVLKDENENGEIIGGCVARAKNTAPGEISERELGAAARRWAFRMNMQKPYRGQKAIAPGESSERELGAAARRWCARQDLNLHGLSTGT